MTEPALFDALLAIFGDADSARAWMTPTLVMAYPFGAIPALQWNGHGYLLLAQAEKWAREKQKQTWDITGKGVVVELRRAVQRQDDGMLDTLAQVIGKRRPRKQVA